MDDSLLTTLSSVFAKYSEKLCQNIETPSTYSGGSFATVDNLITMKITRERFLLPDLKSVLTLGERLIQKYGKWACSNYAPEGCNGFCTSEVRYNKRLYDSKSFGDFSLLSDIYDLRLWNSVPTDNPNTEIATKEEKGFYRIKIPLNGANLTTEDVVRVIYLFVLTENLYG